jgi:hypothetical protein
MILNRLTVKLFLEETRTLDTAAFIPLFHRWIRERTVAGLLIDVADYRHVQDGPAVILVGHEVDYAIDLNGGRPGLLVRLKRSAAGDLATRLHSLLGLAALARDAIEAEPALKNSVRFDRGRLEIAFPDRLRAPNTAVSLASLRPIVERVVGELFGEAMGVNHAGADQRWPLTLTVEKMESSVGSEQGAVSELK